MESSDNYFILLARVIKDGSRKPSKRLGSWNGEIPAKKTRPEKIIDEEGLSQDLTDDKQPLQSLESPDNNSQILPVESMGSFPNPLSSASDIADTTIKSFPRVSEKHELDPDILCLSMKKLKLCEKKEKRKADGEGKKRNLTEYGSSAINQQLVSNAESTFLEKSENFGPVEDPDILDSCASDPSTNTISLKNDMQSDYFTLSDESNLIKSFENKDKLCSVGNADEYFKENSSSNSDDAFCKLFGFDDDEPEGFSFEGRIFSTRLHVDLILEDKLLSKSLKDANHVVVPNHSRYGIGTDLYENIRNLKVFKNKLKNFNSLTERMDIHQMLDDDEFINLHELYSQDCSELDIFEDRWSNTGFNWNLASEGCKELDSTEKSVACPPMSATNGVKENKCTINSTSSASLDEKAEEHFHIGKITKAVECFNSSSGKEDSSKQKSDNSKELEEIPSLLPFIQKSGPETVIKGLATNKEINILEANQLPSFKKSISIDPVADHISPKRKKLVQTAPAESQISGSANNSTNGTK